MHFWGDSIGTVYSCNPKVVRINESRNVVGVSQNHLAGKSDQDVKGVIIQKQQIDSIPEDINLFFTNLEGIYFSDCPIKSFGKNDLLPFPRLKHFAIVRGQLKTIDGDVFKYLPELLYILFRGNSITNVGPGIFQYSPKLNWASFEANLCINSQANDRTAVANVGRELAFKCPPSVEMIEKIILEGTKFQEALKGPLNLTAIDDRFQQLEEKNQVLSYNNTSFRTLIVKRVQQLENENQNALERIEALEKVNLNFCAVFPSFCP